MALTFQAAAQTDIGRARRSNQDAFGQDEAFGLFVVCDGMGGAAGGDLASTMATETFVATARHELQTLRSQSAQSICVALQRGVAAANRAVIERASWDICYRGMGSTLVAACICADQLTVIHVGDSRAHLIRAGQATQLTEDHSLVAEQVRRGLLTASQAETSAMKSVITRAIGAEPDVRPDLRTLTLEPGDILLLSSDGLTRHVDQEELAAILSGPGARPLTELCAQLVDLANDRGGSDNITCVVLRFEDQA